MPYEKTGRPAGRPRKDGSPASPPKEDAKPPGRPRKDGLPPGHKFDPYEGGLCREHFPTGWPAEALQGGCEHGLFKREFAHKAVD